MDDDLVFIKMPGICCSFPCLENITFHYVLATGSLREA